MSLFYVLDIMRIVGDSLSRQLDEGKIYLLCYQALYRSQEGRPKTMRKGH